MNRREASPSARSESNEPAQIPTPALRFCRLSTQRTQMTFLVAPA